MERSESIRNFCSREHGETDAEYRPGIVTEEVIEPVEVLAANVFEEVRVMVKEKRAAVRYGKVEPFIAN